MARPLMQPRQRLDWYRPQAALAHADGLAEMSDLHLQAAVAPRDPTFKAGAEAAWGREL